MGAIFLRHGNTFIAMREQEYEAEDVLQALIAEHPEVLAGDEADVSSSWLLVKRETPVQSLSLDHLLRDVVERLDYLDAATGLSHLYIGYAEVIRHLFGMR